MLAPLFCSFLWVIEAGPCHERPWDRSFQLCVRFYMFSHAIQHRASDVGDRDINPKSKQNAYEQVSQWQQKVTKNILPDHPMFFSADTPFKQCCAMLVHPCKSSQASMLLGGDPMPPYGPISDQDPCFVKSTHPSNEKQFIFPKKRTKWSSPLGYVVAWRQSGSPNVTKWIDFKQGARLMLNRKPNQQKLNLNLQRKVYA